MSIFEKILKDKVGEEELPGIIEAINKELPLHYMPKGVYNEVSEELKTYKAKNESLIKDLTDKGKTTEEKDNMIAQLQSDYDTFKADTEKRITNIQKKTRLELELGKVVTPDALDLLIDKIDIEAVEMQENEITNFIDVIAPLKEKRPSLFKEMKLETDPPPGGENPDPDPTGIDVDKELAKRNLTSLI